MPSRDSCREKNLSCLALTLPRCHHDCSFVIKNSDVFQKLLSREILSLCCADTVKTNKLSCASNRDYLLFAGNKEWRYQETFVEKKLLLCFVHSVKRRKFICSSMLSRDSCRETLFLFHVDTIKKNEFFCVTKRDYFRVIRSDAVKGLLSRENLVLFVLTLSREKFYFRVIKTVLLS